MTVREICEKIIEICRRKNSEYKKDKEEARKLYREIDRRDTAKNEEDIDAILFLHQQLCETRGRNASYIEHELARLHINDMPYLIREADKEIPDVVETLQEHYGEDARPSLRSNAKLLKYAKEIVASKPDKSKRYTKRVTEALRWLDELNRFYTIEGIKDIFMSKIHDEDKNLQFFALIGLEAYYAYEGADKMTKKEVEAIENIIETTTSNYNAVSCCKILVYSGEITDWDAGDMMDDWKERNWN